MKVRGSLFVAFGDSIFEKEVNLVTRDVIVINSSLSHHEESDS